MQTPPKPNRFNVGAHFTAGGFFVGIAIVGRPYDFGTAALVLMGALMVAAASIALNLYR